MTVKNGLLLQRVQAELDRLDGGDVFVPAGEHDVWEPIVVPLGRRLRPDPAGDVVLVGHTAPVIIVDPKALVGDVWGFEFRFRQVLELEVSGG